MLMTTVTQRRLLSACHVTVSGAQVPFTSEEARHEFQRRFQKAADKPEHVEDRQLYRRLLRLNFSPEILQEAARDYWAQDRVEHDREKLRHARRVANETADLLKLLIEKLEQLNTACGDHLDALDLKLDPERRRLALVGKLPDMRMFIQLLENVMIDVYDEHTNEKKRGSFDSADAVLAFLDGSVRLLQEHQGRSAKGDWQALAGVLAIAREALPEHTNPLPGVGTVDQLRNKVKAFREKFPRQHGVTQRLAREAVAMMAGQRGPARPRASTE